MRTVLGAWVGPIAALTPRFEQVWVPFIGTVTGALITGLVAFIAYRHQKMRDNGQDAARAEVSIVAGFSQLTKRLQDQIAAQDERLSYYDGKLETLQEEVDECNRDRQDLRSQIELAHQRLDQYE